MRTLLLVALSGLLLTADVLSGQEVTREDIPRLMKNLKSSVPGVRAAAANDLGELGAVRASDTKEAIPIFIEMVKKDKDAGVRKAAATALARVDADPKLAVPVLVEALKDGSEPVRIAAIEALGILGPAARPAVKPLREIQKDKEKKQLSRAAGMALKRINAKE
jgi:HEAT repeat protein